jgi:hypothetical protein
LASPLGGGVTAVQNDSRTTSSRSAERAASTELRHVVRNARSTPTRASATSAARVRSPHPGPPRRRCPRHPRGVALQNLTGAPAFSPRAGTATHRAGRAHRQVPHDCLVRNWCTAPRPGCRGLSAGRRGPDGCRRCRASDKLGVS